MLYNMEQRDKIRILMDALCLKKDVATESGTMAWSIVPTTTSIWTDEEYKKIKNTLFELLQQL